MAETENMGGNCDCCPPKITIVQVKKDTLYKNHLKKTEGYREHIPIRKLG